MEPSPTRRRSFVVRAPSSASSVDSDGGPRNDDESIAWATALREARRKQAASTEDPPTPAVHYVLLVGLCAFLFIMVQLYSQVTSMDSFVQPDRQMAPLVLEVPVDLATLYTGGTYTATIEKQVVCNLCQGHGYDQAAGMHKCPVCGGAGIVVHEQRFGRRVHRVRMGCDHCGRSGHLPNHVCPRCHGHGHHRTESSVSFTIAPGMMHGEEVILQGAGNAQRHVATGDVVLRLMPARTASRFLRRGHDLETTVSITLLEALTGVTKVIRHLDGRDVQIETHDVVHPQTLLRIPRQGMPCRGLQATYGDLLVRFRIQFPETLTPDQVAGVSFLLEDKEQTTS
ncbi:DnaJ domain containing protein [Achlya hypogyna]|uniref:DnaJ domain containing protein n=1 Tax=Achlya hypogyna TaxID=1202772 RepID=A0A1V9YK96_ACHHY|nr:DnaJ domain containing protein [Achlya hypogyna]